jgi:cytochrome oxidase Cu insertion factor (SCO1/SenC/PrrC family)
MRTAYYHSALPLLIALLSINLPILCADDGSKSTSTAVAAEPVGLEVGKAAPDFEVTVQDGSQLELSNFRGKTHLLVVFGRAHW